jgi:CRISPR system Cascade subunit CasE
MMYLSRIALNKRLQKSRQAIAFPQMMHATVLDSFPPSLVTEKDRDARMLWRLDTIGNDTYLYVLSERKPDFSHIVEQFGWPTSNQEWETKDYTPFLERLEAGQKWQFRLQANPVHTVGGKIYAHVTVDQQKQWLRDRTEKNGFSFLKLEWNGESHDMFDVIYRDTIKFKKRPSDASHVILSVATFEGNMVINDAEQVKHALCSGIGRAKAYGCGLLTLAQIK